MSFAVCCHNSCLSVMHCATTALRMEHHTYVQVYEVVNLNSDLDINNTELFFACATEYNCLLWMQTTTWSHINRLNINSNYVCLDCNDSILWVARPYISYVVENSKLEMTKSVSYCANRHEASSFKLYAYYDHIGTIFHDMHSSKEH